GGGFANHRKVGFRLNQVAQSRQHDRMIISEHNARLVRHSNSSRGSMGMRAKSAVPTPSLDSISSVPPIIESRSRMLDIPSAPYLRGAPSLSSRSKPSPLSSIVS